MPNFPAGELEATVVGQLRTLLRSPSVISEVLASAQKHDSSLDEAQVTVALNQVDVIWEQLFPKEQTRILQLLIEKIVVTTDNLDIRLRDNGIEALALDLTEPDSEEVEHERV